MVSCQVLAPATFSIVACDLRTGEAGVATQSKFFAIGAAVPHARAGAGAAAMQSWYEPMQGPKTLRLLEGGASAEDVLEGLLSGDPGVNARQIGIVDRAGRAAAFTGPHSAHWAGHEVGDGFCCIGNYLASPQVLTAMAETFRTSSAPLPERLVAALEAGQQAGGDRRGKQSAALYVARADSGFAWSGDRYIDIRVDDHREPLQELERLLRVFRASVWGRLMEPVVVLDTDLVQFVQLSLRQQGRLDGETPGHWDEPTRQALQSFCADFRLKMPLPLDGVALPQAYFRELMRDMVR
jgi:uncharacterized Ntn-hydrolase superfamily protein